MSNFVICDKNDRRLYVTTDELCVLIDNKLIAHVNVIHKLIDSCSLETAFRVIYCAQNGLEIVGGVYALLKNKEDWTTYMMAAEKAKATFIVFRPDCMFAEHVDGPILHPCLVVTFSDDQHTANFHFKMRHQFIYPHAAISLIQSAILRSMS